MGETPLEIDSGNLRLGEGTESQRASALALLSSMSLERRTVLALAIARKLSYREISQRLGIEEDQTKVHLRDGLTSMYRAVTSQAHPRLL